MLAVGLFPNAILRFPYIAGQWTSLFLQVPGTAFFCIKMRLSRRLHSLAPLPTTAPESAGLCALGAVGNLVLVTAHQ